MDEFSAQMRVVSQAVEAEPKSGPQCKAALEQLTYVAGDDEVDVASLQMLIKQYDKKVDRLQAALQSADLDALREIVDEWNFEPDHPALLEAQALLAPPPAEEAPAEAEGTAAEGEELAPADAEVGDSADAPEEAAEAEATGE